MDFEEFMKIIRGMQSDNKSLSPMKDGKDSSILGADNLNMQQKVKKMGGLVEPDGSLINTNAKDAGGYTDASASGIDGAVKGFQVGGPIGAAVGAVTGVAKGFQNRRAEHRNNQTRLQNAGQQQAADSYHAFDKIIGGLR